MPVGVNSSCFTTGESVHLSILHPGCMIPPEGWWLGFPDTNSPGGSYCLRCAWCRRSKKTAEDLFVMLTLPQSSTLEQRNYLFTMKCTGKYCLASVRKKSYFTSACTFFKRFLYICIYLCFYYKIARIKLLVSVASFIGARVKAVSVKKINYLYTCGIEASSEL